MLGYVADEIIKPADPALIPATNGFRYGSSSVVVLSTTRTDVSVLALTRPRPGEVLDDRRRVGALGGSHHRGDVRATLSGSEPYWRWKPPMVGTLASFAGTVWATGARFSGSPMGGAVADGGRAASPAAGAQPPGQRDRGKSRPLRVCTLPPFLVEGDPQRRRGPALQGR